MKKKVAAVLGGLVLASAVPVMGAPAANAVKNADHPCKPPLQYYIGDLGGSIPEWTFDPRPPC